MNPQSRRRNPRKSTPTNNTFDSQGPDGKIRGTASQIFEKYMALARDANSSGDRVSAESFYQFADHYFRLINPTNENEGQPMWRDEPRSRSFQQPSFSSESQETPLPANAFPEDTLKIENPPVKNRSSSNERSPGRDQRFENRRSRHPYLGGSSRPYADRQKRSEAPSESISSEAAPSEPAPSSSSEIKQDIITVIQ